MWHLFRKKKKEPRGKESHHHHHHHHHQSSSTTLLIYHYLFFSVFSYASSIQPSSNSWIFEKSCNYISRTLLGSLSTKRNETWSPVLGKVIFHLDTQWMLIDVLTVTPRGRLEKPQGYLVYGWCPWAPWKPFRGMSSFPNLHLYL